MGSCPSHTGVTSIMNNWEHLWSPEQRLGTTVCCVFQPDNRCSIHSSLVEINFLRPFSCCRQKRQKMFKFKYGCIQAVRLEIKIKNKLQA